MPPLVHFSVAGVNSFLYHVLDQYKRYHFKKTSSPTQDLLGGYLITLPFGSNEETSELGRGRVGSHDVTFNRGIISSVTFSMLYFLSLNLFPYLKELITL